MDNRKLAKFATVWCNPGVLDRMAKSDENSAQLIECVNPAHLYLGSIHYLQPDCVGKWATTMDDPTLVKITTPEGHEFRIYRSGKFSGFPEGSIILNFVECYVSDEIERFRAKSVDSDEFWQASEALLKHSE